MRIRPVGAELFHAGIHTHTQEDGWTDIKKLIIASHNFRNALKSRKL